MAMTANEWQQSRSFFAMWTKNRWPRTFYRKMRLFGCACCKRLGPLLIDPRSQDALDVARKYADGLVGKDEIKLARRQAYLAGNNFVSFTIGSDIHEEADLEKAKAWAASAAEMTTHLTIHDAFGTAAMRARSALFHSSRIRTIEEEDANQAILLHDIVGNRFQRAVIEPACLSLNSGIVQKIALGIYERESFDELPILGDALEEAGCSNVDVLEHCRAPGPHVRGCWVVDLVLGKS